MKNGLDEQYIDLLKDILENGVEKDTRNGKTLSVFGRQIRYKFKDGKFPLLTTKKMYWKGIVTELLWFLRGSTNIKYLVDNDCHIWDGDAYQAYLRECEKLTLETLHVPYQDTHLYGTLSSTISNAKFRPYTKEEFINKIKTDDEFAKKFGSLGPIYGKQWRNWTKDKDAGAVEDGVFVEYEQIDQISNLIEQLKTNPDSRRLMVNAWNVGELDQMTLPPCHYGFQVYTRELSDKERYDYWFKNNYETGMEYNESNIPNFDDDYYTITPKRSISLMWNQRSVDTFLGLPFNIASYGLLLEIIAKEVNMVPNELIGNLGDVHLYKNHIEQAKEQLTREPKRLPTLEIIEREEQNFSMDEMYIDNFQFPNYQSHPSIKAPLSN